MQGQNVKAGGGAYGMISQTVADKKSNNNSYYKYLKSEMPIRIEPSSERSKEQRNEYVDKVPGVGPVTEQSQLETPISRELRLKVTGE